MITAREQYQRALEQFDRVIESFPVDRWEDATPCEEWTARMLAGHVIDGVRQVAGMITRQPRVPVGEADELAQVAGATPLASWRDARAELQRVLDAVADDAIAVTPMGEQRVDAVLATALIEPLVHAWDLATAAHRRIELDRDAVDAVLAALEPMGDGLAATGMFAPARAVHDGMTAQERLLALTGRDPALASSSRRRGGTIG